MKKKVIIYISIIIFSILSLFLNLNNNKELTNDKIEIDKNSLISIMVETSSGNYEQRDDGSFPGRGYSFNKEKSYCLDINGIIVDDVDMNYEPANDNAKVLLSTSKNVTCVAYFDKVPEYTVNLTVINGTSNVPSVTLYSGEDAEFIITPGTDVLLEIKEDTCGGEFIVEDSKYIFKNVTGNKNCSITLKEKFKTMASYLIDGELKDTPEVYGMKRYYGESTSYATCSYTDAKSIQTNDISQNCVCCTYYYNGRPDSNYCYFTNQTSDEKQNELGSNYYRCYYGNNDIHYANFQEKNYIKMDGDSELYRIIGVVTSDDISNIGAKIGMIKLVKTTSYERGMWDAVSVPNGTSWANIKNYEKTWDRTSMANALNGKTSSKVFIGNSDGPSNNSVIPFYYNYILKNNLEDYIAHNIYYDCTKYSEHNPKTSEYTACNIPLDIGVIENRDYLCSLNSECNDVGGWMGTNPSSWTTSYYGSYVYSSQSASYVPASTSAYLYSFFVNYRYLGTSAYWLYSVSYNPIYNTMVGKTYYSSLYITPTFYLNSNVNYKSGTGTKDDPYIVTLN